MSKDDSVDNDDIYNFDYLKGNILDPARPKFRPRAILAQPDNRVKLPPVLIGRNIAAVNNEKMAAMANKEMLLYTANKGDAEKDWHKERMKLRAPRQPQKEFYNQIQNDRRVLLTSIPDYEQPRLQSKLPEIKGTVSTNKDIPAEGLRYPFSDLNNGQSNGCEYKTKSQGHPIFPDPRPMGQRSIARDQRQKEIKENKGTTGDQDLRYSFSDFNSDQSNCFGYRTQSHGHPIFPDPRPMGERCDVKDQRHPLFPHQKPVAQRYDNDRDKSQQRFPSQTPMTQGREEWYTAYIDPRPMAKRSEISGEEYVAYPGLRQVAQRSENRGEGYVACPDARSVAQRYDGGVQGRSSYPNPRCDTSPIKLRDGATVLDIEKNFERWVNDAKGDKPLQNNEAWRKTSTSRPSVFDKDYLTPEEKAAAAKIDLEKVYAMEQQELRKSRDTTALHLPTIPKPPSIPKPVERSDYSRVHRRVRFAEGCGDTHYSEGHLNGIREDILGKAAETRDAPAKIPIPPCQPRSETQVYRKRDPRKRFAVNKELNQDVSVHKESRPYHKARPNTPYIIDNDKEVGEANVINKKFEDINKVVHRAKPRDDGAQECLNTIDEILRSPTDSSIEVGVTTAPKIRKQKETYFQ